MEGLGHTLLLALALVFVIEGLLYAVFPSHIQNIMKAALEMEPEKLRSFGAAIIALGVLVVWIVQKITT